MFPQRPHDNDDIDYDFDEVDTKLYEYTHGSCIFWSGYFSTVSVLQILHIYLTETINFEENVKYHTRTNFTIYGDIPS